MLQYAGVLNETEKPLIEVYDEALPSGEQCENWFSCSEFDHILIKTQKLKTDPHSLSLGAKSILSKNGNLILFCSPVNLGERISRILSFECGQNDLASKLEKAEVSFFNDYKNSIAEIWDENKYISAFEENGFSVTVSLIEQKEERLISEKDLNTWFNTEQSRWGAFISKELSSNDFKEVENAIRLRITKGAILWRWKSICLKANVNIPKKV